MTYEKGWLKRRVALAAQEYDQWPRSMRSALKLTTSQDVKDGGMPKKNLPTSLGQNY